MENTRARNHIKRIVTYMTEEIGELNIDEGIRFHYIETLKEINKLLEKMRGNKHEKNSLNNS